MHSSRKAWLVVLCLVGGGGLAVHFRDRCRQVPPPAAPAMTQAEYAELIRRAVAARTAAAADRPTPDRHTDAPDPSRGMILIAPVRPATTRPASSAVPPRPAARTVAATPAALPSAVTVAATPPTLPKPAAVRAAAVPPSPPSTAGDFRRLGDALTRQDRLDDALDAFRQAARLDPKDALAYRGAGLIYARKGDFLRAIGLWDRAVRLAVGAATAATADVR